MRIDSAITELNGLLQDNEKGWLDLDIIRESILIQSKITKIIDELILAVLSGEYIRGDVINTVNNAFDSKGGVFKIDNILNKIKNKASDTNNQFVSKINNTVSTAKECFLLFNKLSQISVDHLDSNFATQSKFYFIDATSKIFSVEKINNIEKDINNFFLSEAEDDIYFKVILYKSAILLSELDSRLECSGKVLRVLVRLYRAFREAETNYEKIRIVNPFFLNTLKDKCSFLIYKIAKRLEVDAIVSEDYEDITQNEININTLINNNSTFIQFYIQTNDIYSIDKSDKVKIRVAINDYKEKGDINKICDFHKYSKLLYKNKALDIISIDDCIKHASDFLKTKSNSIDENIIKFDLIAKTNILFLCYKNKIKMISNEAEKIIAKNILSIETIEEVSNKLIDTYNEIIVFIENNNTILNNYQIDDYYHNLIFADTVYQLAQYCLINSLYSPRLKNIADMLLDETRIGFDNNFKISINTKGLIYDIENSIKSARRRNYMPIYLTYDDCCIRDNNDYKIPLFLDSSYVLPVNYLKQEKRIRELKYDYHYLFSLKTRVEYFEKNFSKIEEKIDDIFKIKNNELSETTKKEKEDIEKGIEKKVSEANISGIQILGTFSGVIALVFSFIYTVKEPHEIREGIIYMLGFSLCLGLFIVALKHIANSEKRIKNKGEQFQLQDLLYFNKVYLIYLAVLLALLILYMLTK